MKLPEIEILDKIANYYKNTSVLPNNLTWVALRGENMPTWRDIVRLFGSKKKLRTRLKFHISKRWDLDKLRDGFRKFYDEKGHFPTAPEVDNCLYLPSSRNIQRYFGGLVNLRKVLGLEVTSFATGQFRSRWAGIYNRDARVTESNVRSFLDERFGEICVHEEKKYGNGKNTADFFVYASKNFGVDVFKTSSYHNLAKNINIKQGKYNDVSFQLYFVVIGDMFEQEVIDKMMINKKDKPLLSNMKCVTFKEFVNVCQDIIPLVVETPYIKVNNIKELKENV